MKDFPVFTTQYGAASLILREIPYTGKAYIRLQATLQPRELLEECVSFCSACGGETILATGHGYLTAYPLETTVVQMQCPVDAVGQTDAAVFPVLPENLARWRQIYNEKMADVPNASYMSEKDARELLESGDGYFVHRDGTLLGIGKASGDTIDAVISVMPGMGQTVVQALASILTEDTVRLTVADTNERAMKLYTRMGFVKTRELSRWYRIR